MVTDTQSKKSLHGGANAKLAIGTASDAIEQVTDNQAFIVFMPSGQRGYVQKGISVLDAARQMEVDLDSICGGNAICGRCQVEYTFGDLPKLKIHSAINNVSPFGSSEQRFDKRVGLKPGRRLGCCSIISGDLVVNVPPESQVHKQIISKQTNLDYSQNMQPMVRLYVVTVAEADLHDATGDSERVITALKNQHKIIAHTFYSTLLIDLQQALRKNNWQISVAVRENAIIGIWGGIKEAIYGIAFDVGSTTISGTLANLVTGFVMGSTGQMNPQIRFGEDLMSRVSYAMMNENGTDQMCDAVRNSLADLTTELIETHQLLPGDVIELTVVCNPVMHHILLGISPVELGNAPFALATNQSITLLAKDWNLPVHRCAHIYILPCVAGHVGADAAAVMLAKEPWNDDDNVLIIDVGTNAEITLGYQGNRILSCSSPTGPALEGAQISSGQRAANGAIEHVRISPFTLEPRFQVIGIEGWSDEPPFQASNVTVSGICGSGIIEAIAELYLAGIITSSGIMNSSLADKCPRLVKNDRTYNYLLHKNESTEIYITQNDVRAIQLAKGALYAGARLLMDRVKIEFVDRIILAGAFGSHIDPKYALILGMFPDCYVSNVSSAGNAAGTGALKALTSKAARATIETRIQQVEKIETAIDPNFQKYFVSAMGIPNRDDPYLKLSETVTLPNPEDAQKQMDVFAQTQTNRVRRRHRHV